MGKALQKKSPRKLYLNKVERFDVIIKRTGNFLVYMIFLCYCIFAYLGCYNSYHLFSKAAIDPEKYVEFYYVNRDLDIRDWNPDRISLVYRAVLGENIISDFEPFGTTYFDPYYLRFDVVMSNDKDIIGIVESFNNEKVVILLELSSGWMWPIYRTKRDFKKIKQEAELRLKKLNEGGNNRQYKLANDPVWTSSLLLNPQKACEIRKSSDR